MWEIVGNVYILFWKELMGQSLDSEMRETWLMWEENATKYKEEIKCVIISGPFYVKREKSLWTF